ncbi:MAG TPA: NAD-dependent epimerase/dehydratase family protein [Caldilinea sp.]|nr:NAD-dependent epimerase/dehydratase family protein [Caldilinea sp.]
MAPFSYSNAVIFGAGQVGMTLMEQLAVEGVQVTLVNRSGKVKEALPAGVTVVAGDLTDPATVARLARTADVVFETAQPEYTEWPERWPPLVRSIIDGMAQTNARLVFVDNLYMYGPTHGRPIRENMPYAADGPKGKTRAAIATMLLDAHAAGKVKVVIGRASDFFGPRATDTAIFGDRFFDALFAGKPVDTFGDVNLPHTYTYVPDFARALITLSRHEEAYGRAWHVPNTTVSTAEMMRLFGKAAGTPVKSRKVNRLMLSMVGLFVPIVREMKEMLYEFEEAYVVDDSDFRASFGAELTPLPEAAAATVAWFRQHLATPMKQAA